MDALSSRMDEVEKKIHVGLTAPSVAPPVTSCVATPVSDVSFPPKTTGGRQLTLMDSFARAAARRDVEIAAGIRDLLATAREMMASTERRNDELLSVVARAAGTEPDCDRAPGCDRNSE